MKTTTATSLFELPLSSVRNRRKPKPLRNVALLVLAFTLAGSAYLIHRGESDIWASEQTKNAKPSIQIIP